MPEFDPIEYLVARRFPLAFLAALSFKSNPALGKKQQEQRIEAEQYRKELEKLSPEKIDQLVKAEQQNEAAEIAQKEANTRKAEDDKRFFNQPSAFADNVHWSKPVYWTLEEAIALSLGRAPERVKWKWVEGHNGVSPFAVEFARRRDLANRARVVGEITDPIAPGAFIAWGKRQGWQFPTELETAVAERGPIGDWHTLFKSEKAAHQKTKESGAQAQANSQELAVLLANRDKIYDELTRLTTEEMRTKDEIIAKLEEALAIAETKLSARIHSEDANDSADLKTRERDSLLKMVIGMAVRGYSYDPAALKNSSVKEIADDLALLDISLNEDMTTTSWPTSAA
jgi:hypothetical protein